MHDFNPSTWEAEEGRFLSLRLAWYAMWFPGKLGIYRETLSLKKRKKKKRKRKENKKERENEGEKKHRIWNEHSLFKGFNKVLIVGVWEEKEKVSSFS